MKEGGKTMIINSRNSTHLSVSPADTLLEIEILLYLHIEMFLLTFKNLKDLSILEPLYSLPQTPSPCLQIEPSWKVIDCYVWEWG